METLAPLLSWHDCSKHSIHSMPSPRRLVAWAISEGFEYVALLESGSGFQSRARYTFIGLGAEKTVKTDDILSAFNALRLFLREAKCSTTPCRDMIFFILCYEAVAGSEPWLARMLRKHEWPVLVAFKPEILVVYDHAAERVVVCPAKRSLGYKGLQDLEGFKALREVYATPREEFIEWVKRAKKAIEEGEVFQVVLSRLERIEYSGEPLTLYDKLARLNPSPYMYYARFGDLVILGTSPELLVKMDNGRIETHPIAGTRARGLTPLEDIRLEEEMLWDPKERAEHLMLVDLARNDLGRVAIPGTVKVTSLMDVEKYSHVQHIVSRVEALVRPGTSYAEVLEAVFPAGTVTGAPKTRAMELIALLEDEPRGPYAGAIGAATYNAGESAIVIRSAWTLANNLLEIRAGAGIVYDSDPYREYMETEHKLRALKKSMTG